MKNDTKSKFGPTTVALHWIVAITFIALLGVGVYMEQTKTFALYPWHKSIGVLIFVVVLIRVAWRMKNGWPVPVVGLSDFERWSSRLIHYVLIIGTVIMPIAGIAMSALGGQGVAVFGLELFARNPDPADPQKVVAHDKGLAQFFGTVHFLVGYLLIVCVTLHIAGALKHHFIDKDGTLRRMLGSEV